MKTLAIDASTKSTGIAIFQGSHLIHYECLKASSDNVYKRIKDMQKQIMEVFKKYNPDNIVLEEVIPEDVKQNRKIYKALIYLQAMIVVNLGVLGYKVDLYVANHWRSLCGIKTGAGIPRQRLKEASQKIVKQIYQKEVNDDISDAICLGIAYLQQHRNAF